MADETIAGEGLPSTRAEAKRLKAKRYFTGKPCLRGHIAPRLVSSMACDQCVAEAQRARRRPPREIRTVLHEGPVVTRSAALEAGQTWYFTGRACKRGHLARRWVPTCECSACCSERQKRYRAEDPERILARDATYRTAERRAKERAWHERTIEDRRAARRRYHTENPERNKARVRQRRARIKGAAGNFTAEEFAEVVRKQRHRCAYCRTDLRKKRPSPDHIVPLSKGGTNHISNIQACCLPCNRRKSARDPLDFARASGLLL